MAEFQVRKRASKGTQYYWPDEVLRKIFSRIPFPDVMNVSAISRTWRRSFARLVSSKWADYCPVLLTYPRTHDGLSSSSSMRTRRTSRLVAFNGALKRWEHLPLPRSISGSRYHISLVRIHGPFMVQVYTFVSRFRRETKLCDVLSSDERVRVANIFTGEFVRLPAMTGLNVKVEVKRLGVEQGKYEVMRNCSLGEGDYSPHLVDVAFFSEGGEFRVLMIYRLSPYMQLGSGLERLVMFEFQSSTGLWKRKLTSMDVDSLTLMSQCTALRGGYLYTLGLNPTRIWRYGLEGLGSRDVVCSQRSDDLGKDLSWPGDFGGLALVGSKTMAVTVNCLDDTACVYIVNEETLQLTEESSVHIGDLISWDSNQMRNESWDSSYRVATDDKSIFVWPLHESGHDALVYDVATKKWSKLLLPRVEGSWGWMFVIGSARVQLASEPFWVVRSDERNFSGWQNVCE